MLCSIRQILWERPNPFVSTCRPTERNLPLTAILRVSSLRENWYGLILVTRFLTSGSFRFFFQSMLWPFIMISISYIKWLDIHLNLLKLQMTIWTNAFPPYTGAWLGLKWNGRIYKSGVPHDTLPGEIHWLWYHMTHCQVKYTGCGTTWHIVR
jgi:hypothetical protein